MKRQRSGDNVASPRKRQITEVDEVTRHLQRCRTDLQSCIESARIQLRERETQVRQAMRASFQEREHELQAALQGQTGVIHSLKQKLAAVRHGLDVTKRQIEQLPHSIIMEYPQVWQRQRHEYNAIAENYNKLYKIIDR